MRIIEAKYLTKVYKNGAYGLKNCTFDLADGEFLVIVGASGSGKSTLLKVIAGTEGLSSGELYFDGILSENVPVSKRDVSMVFQEYVLYPHMTVFDNLATPLRQKGEDERSIYKRVMDALSLFGLEVAADVKPKNLSGGEQQRVALAKALLKRSRLILLDEPMSNVDEKSRREYCHALKKMKQMLPESSFIYVTHNTAEALFLADRIAVMKDGAILQIAPVDLLMKYPEHPEVVQIMSGRADEPFGGDEVEPDLPMSELKLSGLLDGDRLELDGAAIRLDDKYLSRLLRSASMVKVGILIDRLSKTPLSDSIPLVFRVLENRGDHLVLKIQDKSFVLCRKTALRQGEKIRLYYKTDDLIIYDGRDRLTCHYPLHRRVDISVVNGSRGIFKAFGKRIRINRPIPQNARYLCITESGFRLSYEKNKCSFRIEGCLDEEFINGKKLSQIAVKGTDQYLSIIGDTEVSCFDKRRVWLNLIPDGLVFK